MAYTFTREELVNRTFWDEIAEVHYKAYNLEPLRERKSSLIDQIQKDAFYPIKDKSILHLQCHIGTDSLSLALDGAQVTGIDFSEESINQAHRLSKEMSIPGTFIQGSIYDAPQLCPDPFDMVYTGKGALMWLPDIKRWAETVSACLKPGGIFYIIEVHPFFFNCEEEEASYVFKDPYFPKGKVLFFDEEWPDYADANHISSNPTYEWQWTVSDILNALIKSGLTIEMVDEIEYAFYKALPSLKRVPGQDEGWYYWPEHEGKFPMSIAIKARKM